MFKLKLINKPKMMKLKCNFTFPNIVLADLQEKEVTPSKEIQEVIADKPYDGLSKVTVQSIPEEYIVPVGTKEIATNGNYDVREYANASVNVPDKLLGTKTITANGTYLASDDNLDGYDKVVVQFEGLKNKATMLTTLSLSPSASKRIIELITELPKINITGVNSLSSLFNGFKNLKNVDVSEWDTSDVTNMSYLLSDTSIENIDLSGFNTSNVSNMNGMFELSKIKELNLTNFDTSNVKYMYAMFNQSKLQTLDISSFDASKVINIKYMFVDVPLENLKFMRNLGAGYLPTASANYSDYTLDVSSNSLSYNSLMSVFNNVYNIASIGIKPQRLIIGSDNTLKVTSEEIAIATSKGWTVS